VLYLSSHNHCVVPLVVERLWNYTGEVQPDSTLTLSPAGQRWLAMLGAAVACLPVRLEPVTVSWAMGREGRISYRRKGHRADGSSYFMREDERRALGADFRGEIDDEAPVVRLATPAGRTVAWLGQFAAHPVTAYHPERPLIHPEFCGVACDLLAGPEGTPTGFLQGCCGDLNSKNFLSGDTLIATHYGTMLAETWRAAARHLTPAGDRLDFAVSTVALPFAPLPPLAHLLAEQAELQAFAARARAGDEDTLTCVGLNFPRTLSPAYRAALIDRPALTNAWMIAQHHAGAPPPPPLVMRSPVVRLGEVAIVGWACEPFMAIGRRLRARSPAALTLACGYCNFSTGYITDGGNLGGNEYMSTFYRYARRHQFSPPTGDALADDATATLRDLWSRS